MQRRKTINNFGATDEYSGSTQSSEQFNIVKGNLNKLRLRPQIQNEHVESSREALDVVDSSTVIGQMFRASQDNINGISLTLESAATFASADAITSGAGENKAGTMEYSDNAALQAEYIKSGAVEATVSAFTDLASITQDGTYAMKIPTTTLADDWRVTLTSTDLTGVTFSLKFSQTGTFTQQKVYFFIGDGTNTKSFPLTVGSPNIWQTFKIPETSMVVESTDDTATTPNMGAITKMGFRIDDKLVSGFGYVDSITYQAQPGTVDLELWNMGTTLPDSDGTVDYTSKNQYTTLGDLGIAGSVASSVSLPLTGGKRKYHIDSFIAGVAEEIPTNVKLVKNNYYAIVLKYNDTDVTVYGADTTYEYSYYDNGYAWKAETSDGLIDVIVGAEGSGNYSDCMFQIFSSQDVYIDEVDLLFDNAPGNDFSISVYSEDSNMSIADIALSEQKGGMGRTLICYDLSDRHSYLEKGGKLEAYMNDDPTDSLSLVLFIAKYFYVPPTVHG